MSCLKVGATGCTELKTRAALLNKMDIGIAVSRTVSVKRRVFFDSTRRRSYDFYSEELQCPNERVKSNRKLHTQTEKMKRLLISESIPVSCEQKSFRREICIQGYSSARSEALAFALPFGVSFANAFCELTGNHVFMCAFLSWLVAQVAKVFTAYYREGHWDYRVMFDSGGMPSSHTSLVVGLTTSIAHQHGLGSVYFPLALAFSLIVMYDAAGVRRHAGKQAEVLNKILADTFHGTPLSNTKLKEVLGHSPLQVVCGAIVGVLVSSLYMLKLSF